MNYAGADAFAGGFARGFGIINSAIDRRDNKAYRKELLGMQKDIHAIKLDEHQRKVDKEEMLDRVNVIRSLQYLNTSDNPEERQLGQDILLKAGNGAFGDELGEGKRFAGFQMVPGQDRVVIQLDVDGYKQPAYVSQNRSSDPKDPYVSLSGKELVDMLLSHPKAGEFKNIARAAMIAAGAKLPEKWSDPKVVGGRLIATEQSTNKPVDLGKAEKGWNSVLPEGVTWDKVGKTYESLFGTAFGGKLDGVTGQWHVPPDNKEKWANSIRTATHISRTLANQGVWIDPHIIGTTVFNDGQPLGEKDARQLAVSQLEKEGHSSWGGLAGPSEDLIKQRTSELIKESKEAMPKILDALEKYVPGQNVAPPKDDSSNTKPVKWEEIPEANRQALLKEAETDEGVRKVLQNRYPGAWEAHKKTLEKEKPEPKPKPKPEPEPKSASPKFDRDTPLTEMMNQKNYRTVGNGRTLIDDIRDGASGIKGALKNIERLPPKELSAARHAFWLKHGRNPDNEQELEAFIVER